eukprot:GFYU01001576.1.p1 GENE.GFYU01001576.1~~GFYU01001576.1.p1  ORF type:complete len:379 (+),score=91.03 GFYU01001576.1:151-1287(+)
MRKTIGFLLPSGNTVVEPLVHAVLDAFPDVTVHFARFLVNDMGMSDAAFAQFDEDKILEAACMLLDAKVDAICLQYSSSAYMGIDLDRRICSRITDATGVPATSSLLAVLEACTLRGAKKVSLLSPFPTDLQTITANNFLEEGFAMVDEIHFEEEDLHAVSLISKAEVDAALAELAKAEPDCIVSLCSNLCVGALVYDHERDEAVPIHDSVLCGVWSALQSAGVDTSVLKEDWGKIFSFKKPGTTVSTPQQGLDGSMAVVANRQLNHVLEKRPSFAVDAQVRWSMNEMKRKTSQLRGCLPEIRTTCEANRAELGESLRKKSTAGFVVDNGLKFGMSGRKRVENALLLAGNSKIASAVQSPRRGSRRMSFTEAIVEEEE